MSSSRIWQNMFVGATATLFIGARFASYRNSIPASATTAVIPVEAVSSDSAKANGISRQVAAAVAALGNLVHPLSHPRALEDAFQSYFAFKSAHEDEVRQPYLYFADYGLPSSTPRGYVFDMDHLRVVEGPFTVAHGRGSQESNGIPTRFSNALGSAATSLGLYVAENLYPFHGNAGGRSYSALGLRLMGVSGGYNDNAFARRVVAHGAPYVRPNGAGRSEGCPAMEVSRAKRLLPKLANGGMVFLFAPDTAWMENDPWLAGE
jgi:L,D-transpeptidase-like protein